MEGGECVAIDAILACCCWSVEHGSHAVGDVCPLHLLTLLHLFQEVAYFVVVGIDLMVRLLLAMAAGDF